MHRQSRLRFTLRNDMSIAIFPATEARCRAVDDIVWREHRDGAVCLRLATEQVFALNATGKFVWAALRHGRSVDDITHALAREFGAPFTDCQTDVRRFVDQLSQHQLSARPEAL